MKQESRLECPKCKTEVAWEATFCPGCGYAFERKIEGAGPFSFAFPEVESAYKPSRKTTFLALFLMVIGGFLAIGVASMSVLLPPPTNLKTLTIMLIVLPSFGYLIGWIVASAGRIGKNRNTWIPMIISAIMSLIYVSGGGPLYFATSFDVSGGGPLYSATKLYPGLWAISIPVLFLFFPILSAIAASYSKASEPFCEYCSQFMTKEIIKTIPIRYEKKMIDLLNSRAFAEVMQLPVAEEPNYCTVYIWYCKSCKRGIISVNTQQTRNEYDTMTRMVFSSIAEKVEVEAIIGDKRL